MDQVIGRTTLGSMQLAHLYVDSEMIGSGRAVCSIQLGAEFETVPREGYAVTTKSHDPDRTYGYDVRVNRARVANAKMYLVRVSKIGWRHGRWFRVWLSGG